MTRDQLIAEILILQQSVVPGLPITASWTSRFLTMLHEVLLALPETEKPE